MIPHFSHLDKTRKSTHNRTMNTIEIISAGRFSVPVLYEDNHLLVVVKPANLPTQADASGDDDLLSILKRHIGNKYQKPGNVYMGLVHRLDRPVGGVMVFARTSKAASRLSEAFARHDQSRQYLAVLQGELKEARTLTNYLLKTETGRQKFTVRAVAEGTPGAKRAQLTTEPIAFKNGLTLARATLYTGRAHQIRVQHAAAGLPLWGDARYGGGRPGQQIALWAYRLAFKHPTKDETLSFLAPPPIAGVWREFEDEIASIECAQA